MTTVSPGRHARAGSAFGNMLREWRRQRGASQLELALNCGLSQRHLSFLESGRSRPSRGMILHLASALSVPLHLQNAMLLAAGFAPVYRERALDAPEMAPVGRALGHLLDKQEPYPAIVVDGTYNILRANRATGAFLAALLESPLPPGEAPNAVELVLRPDRLRPYLENWNETATWLLRRLRAEAMNRRQDGAASALLERVLALPDVAEVARAPNHEQELAPTLVLRIAKGSVRLGLFSMIATFGTPLDVALQDLHIEFFFPADEATERWFREAQAAGC